MKVWLVHDEDHGETYTYAEDRDILEVPVVKNELSYLVGAYEEEREEFIWSINDAKKRGRGAAYIEERLRVELVSVD